MRLDLVHLYKHLHFTNFTHPIVLEALKKWAEEEGWEVRVLVCREKELDLATDAQVIGFSVYTMTAPAAYRLAESFRRQGKIILFGGPHFRGNDTYAEAKGRCDLLAPSISEAQWKNVLRGLAGRTIEARSARPQVIVDRKHSFRYPDGLNQHFQRQRRFQMASVPTSLGCPFQCPFCSPYLKGNYLLRNISAIIDEATGVQGKTIFLSDATFGLSKPFTLELMQRLAPLGKKLLVETTLSRLTDPELIKALAQGGVKWIVVGIESLNLRLNKHGPRRVEEGLRKVIDQVHDKGMLVQGNLICGLDCDGPESFDQLHRFSRTSGLDSIMIDLLTPFPNTPIYAQFRREGRILDDDWEHYDYHHLVYRPLRMNAKQLVDGFLQLYHSLSSWRVIFGKSIQTWREKGWGLESSALVGYHLYNRMDARRKEKAFHQQRNLLVGRGNFL